VCKNNLSSSEKRFCVYTEDDDVRELLDLDAERSTETLRAPQSISAVARIVRVGTRVRPSVRPRESQPGPRVDSC